MKSSALVESDQPMLGSEAVALGNFSNEDKRDLGAAEALRTHVPAKLKKKTIAIAVGCWAAVPISISIGAWQGHSPVITIFSSLILAVQSTWIARFWVDDQ
ncbi:MAG: hypothetical protein ACREEO_02325 [Phenylobacterium sp.]